MATLRRLVSPVVAATISLASADAAGAANYMVGKTTDGAPALAACVDGVLTAGQCSLRDAIAAANGNGGPDVVTLAPGATYGLSHSVAGYENANAEGDLDVTDPLTIVGNGAILDGDPLAERERVLEASMLATGPALTVRDVTITGGRAGPPSGGSHGPGGGITVFVGTGSALLDRVRVTGNRVLSGASTQGGGVSVGGGIVEVRDSLVDANVAEGTNLAGGIIVSGGSLTMTNTTVTGNTGTADGGGVFQFNGTQLHLRNATVAGNTGNVRRSAGATGSAVNSIVASPSSGANCTLNGTTWAPSSGNFSSSADAAADGCAFGSTSLTGTDPLLGSLADNGGPTQTMALGTGSPARDAGSADGSLCPVTDQRGRPRPTDGNGDGTAACDAGAFEAAGVEPPAQQQPPPGGAPPPVIPVPPGDTAAPGLTIGGASRQTPLRRRNSIVFKATSSENGTLTARGTFKVPGDRRTYRFETVTRVVTAGRTVTLKLLIPRRGLSGVKRTLRRGRRINASFTFTATDGAGNKATAKRRVKLAAR